MNAKEIQKLRRKFILIATVSFFLVTSFIGTLINFAIFAVTQIQINAELERISENRHVFDSDDAPHNQPGGPSSMSDFPFCAFTFDASGAEIAYFARKGSPIDKDTVAEIAQTVRKLPTDHGYYAFYAFRLTQNEDGTSSLVLLDIGGILYVRRILTFATVGVGLAGMLITVILVVALSKRAVKPEIENSRRQEQFLTDVSHELKTPLAVIRSNTEMQEMIAGETEWTQSTIRQVDRMNSLIQNLVMITKSREMESRTGTEPVDVSQAVAQTAQDFVSRAEGEGKTLTQQIEPGLELTADGSKIRQLAMLLLDNAVKYCDDGGRIEIRLEPFAKRSKKGVRLIVSNDYAAGRDVDYTRFFERFYREDKSRNIDTGGYGIGLSIAESICTEQNGAIRAAWRDGRISFICELSAFRKS